MSSLSPEHAVFIRHMNAVVAYVFATKGDFRDDVQIASTRKTMHQTRDVLVALGEKPDARIPERVEAVIDAMASINERAKTMSYHEAYSGEAKERLDAHHQRLREVGIGVYMNLVGDDHDMSNPGSSGAEIFFYQYKHIPYQHV